MNKAFVIPDDEHTRIKDLACKSRIGIFLVKNGIRFRFFLDDRFLHCSFPDAKGVKQTIRAYSLSEIQELEKTEGTQTDLFKNHIAKQLQMKNPAMSHEEIDVFSDILNEANGSIKRLIQNGVEPAVAEAIVKETLRDDKFYKKLQKENDTKVDDSIV
jgi:hypothetical protein